MKSIQFFLFLLLSSSMSFGQYDDRHTQILMREIGNKILWSVGDSTSRVLPITKVEKNRYVISFERPINIISDSLYKIVTQELRKINITNFLTEIKECVTEDVILAFLHVSETDSLNPCSGRSTPKNCYKIEVTINEYDTYSPYRMVAKELQKSTKSDDYVSVITEGDSLAPASPFSSSLSNDKVTVNKAGLSLWLLIPLFFSVMSISYFLYNKRKSKKNGELTIDKTDTISIGQYQFDPSKSRLIINGEHSVLTEKEAKLLMILYNGANQAQKRDDLIGEIWGEEGLLVISRNIDVLVSKLRKKLLDDPLLKITNVHGVGYKLEL